MKQLNLRYAPGALFLSLLALSPLHAQSVTGNPAATTASIEGKSALPPLVNDTSSSSSRYGWLDRLDHRSDYGQDVYPEPFLVDDTDLEKNEARVDWEHNVGPGSTSDTVTSEVEKGFGLTTLEIEVPFQWNREDGAKTQGFGNIDIGARTPLFEYVSPNGFLNTTFGTAIEAGIPTFSQVSQNAELVPKLFNDITLGRNFTIQTIVGYSMLYGPGDDGGLDTWEYGFVFGYTIQHKVLPIPFTDQLIPMFELLGETTTDHGPETNLTADAGFRVNLHAIGPVQPRWGVAVVFPMNNVARQETSWGLVTSFVFEY